MQLLGLWDIYQKERQCKYRRNTEAFSGNNGYRGKATLLLFFLLGATTLVQSWPSQQFLSILGDLGLVLYIS